MKGIRFFGAATLCLMVMSATAWGQTLIDSFSDGEFTTNPAWSGDTDSWIIVANSDVAAGATNSNTLRLNFSTAANGMQQLRTQITTSWGNEQEWGFFVGRRAQAFTATNQMIIWLYANEADLESASVDGYRLLIGDNAGDDEILLQRVTDGVGATILTSSGAITNGLTDIGVLIRVTRGSSGVFSLYTSTLPTTNGAGAVATDIPNAINANVPQGSITDTTYTPAANGYLGVVAVHTSGAEPRAAVELDQVYMSPTALFRSVTSGNWNSPTTWQTSFDGTVWVAATSTPTAASNGINVRSPHVVTVTAHVDVDQLIIDSGGQISVNGGVTYAIADGTGTDLTVNGTLSYAGAIVNNGQTSVSGTWVRAGGSLSGNPPTYNPGSALIYDDNAFGFVARGLEWSATSGAGYPYNVQINSGSFLKLSDNISEAGTAWQIAGSLTINSGGELSMAAGTAMSVAFTVLGDISNSGNLTLSTASGGDLNVGGNFTNNATFTNNGRTIAFNGSAPQTIGGSSAISFAGFKTAPGASVAASVDFDVTGNWTNDGAYTGNSETVTFNGTAAQTMGGATPTDFAGVNINNPAGVSLTSNQNINGDLALTSGDLTTGTFTLTQSGTSSGTTDVVGNVRRADLGATARAFGNPNNQISFQSGTPPTEITVNLVKSRPTGAGFGFPNAIDRTYTITPTGGSGYTASLRLRYLDSELNNNNEALLNFWRFNGSVWQGISRSPLGFDPASNWIETNSVTQFSPWTLSDRALVLTAVRLAEFTATSSARGTLLSWRTGYEVNNLGFNLYREQGGVRTLITPSVVAGSALTMGAALTAGFSYSWLDADKTAGALYWLEDIDLDGTRTWHGPVASVAGGAQAMASAPGRALLLGELNGRSGGVRADGGAGTHDGATAFRSPATDPDIIPLPIVQRTSLEEAQQRRLAAQPDAIKLGIRRHGWYRVTQADLAAAGLPDASPQNLRLYTDGREVPMIVGGDPQHFGPGSYIEFYGVALDTAATDTRVYWLVAGNSPGLRIAERHAPATSNANQPPPNFRAAVERRERIIYFSALLNGATENFFGAVVTGAPVAQTLDVPHPDLAGNSPDVLLDVALQGVTWQEHQVRVSFNRMEVGTISFAGREHKVARFTLARSSLREGTNTVTLAANGGSTDVSLVDYIRLSYARLYQANNNALRFSATGGQLVRLAGFSSPHVRVMDITDPFAPQGLAPTVAAENGSYSATVGVPGLQTQERMLMAFVEPAERPASIALNRPSNWHGYQPGADFLLITHREFRDSLEPLRALRESEGLRTVIVDVEDIYDEFSFGASGPEALRAFLAHAQRDWLRQPRYALLVGDSSYDPRDYLQRGSSEFVPTRAIDTREMETASDDWLADFDDDGLPELALGRWPVRTAAQAQALIARIITYQPENAARAALLVNDRRREFDFPAANAQAGALLPAAFSLYAINRDDGPPAEVRAQIVARLNQGPMVVNYFGHGSVDVWTGDGLLRAQDASGLLNGNRLSLYLLMTCLNGYSHSPNLDSLAESLLLGENGGAIAVWASSGMTEPAAQAAMNHQLLRLLFGQATLRLGHAVRQAKEATLDSDARRTWILFGDPTMRLR